MDVLEKVREFVREHLRGERVSGLDHAERVLYWCERLGEAVGANLEVLRLAALLHDVAVPTAGRERHFEEGARMAREFLSELGLPEELIEAVANAIRAHSTFGGPEPRTLEEKVLFDADRLDFIGAIGIARAIARGLSSGAYSGDVSELPELLRRTLEKARKVYTDEAKEVAEGRIKFMEEFIEQLEAELRGEK
ncbi:MAG TPA: HD domain-containing protein [Candidatus Bathyarchaeota archaeon]|nr:HD domain-containing protein [Candidatus Bathyarchaeota archaeon]